MQYQFLDYMVPGFNANDGHMVGRWYRAYYPVIIDKVSLLTGGTPDCLDLASDVVRIILEKKGAFGTVKNIECYMDKVIWTTCGNFLGKQEIKNENPDWLVDHFRNLEDKALKSAHSRDLVAQLMNIAAEMLTGQCRQVFHLYYLEDMKNKEIAKKLGIAERTVEQHKTRAFKILKMEIYNQPGWGRGMFLLDILFPICIFYQIIQKLLS